MPPTGTSTGFRGHFQHEAFLWPTGEDRVSFRSDAPHGLAARHLWNPAKRGLGCRRIYLGLVGYIYVVHSYKRTVYSFP